MSVEKKYNLEELHRGKWVALIADNEKQKIAKITEEEAAIMNGQSAYSNIRYVLAEESNNDSEDELLAVKAEYEVVLGKAPHHKKTIEGMKSEIAEFKKDSE